jgi:hypothetical protein
MFSTQTDSVTSWKVIWFKLFNIVDVLLASVPCRTARYASLPNHSDTRDAGMHATCTSLWHVPCYGGSSDVFGLEAKSSVISQKAKEKHELSWVELSLSYGRRSVDQFVLVSGSRLGPMIRFYPYPFFSDNCFVVLPVGRPLWREDGSVAYSEIAEWSGHWGPITIYRVRQKDLPYLERALCELWWGYGGGGGIDR